jgi:tRNA (guanine-N7-)-methyltransferase
LWVTFPDPFPKERSAKHRLTHPQYLKIYEMLLQKDGALYFKTDAKALFDWSLETLVEEGWNIDELSFDLHESALSEEYKIKTTYETRYMSEGIKINFVKASPPAYL